MMTAPLLENHPRCHSSDPERAQAYLDSVGFRIESLRDDGAAFDMRVNGAYLPGMYIGYTQYGKAATIGPLPSALITGFCCRWRAALKQPCAKTSWTAIGGEECSATRAAVANSYAHKRAAAGSTSF
jgi:hypothetical protein